LRRWPGKPWDWSDTKRGKKISASPWRKSNRTQRFEPILTICVRFCSTFSATQFKPPGLMERLWSTFKSMGGMPKFQFRTGDAAFPEDNVEKIFEPFFSTKSAAEGTGLGLYVTQKIIKKLGGFIAVESQPGHGTTFHVKLPARSIKSH
jgi:hypothetical protein